MWTMRARRVAWLLVDVTQLDPRSSCVSPSLLPRGQLRRVCWILVTSGGSCFIPSASSRAGPDALRLRDEMGTSWLSLRLLVAASPRTNSSPTTSPQSLTEPHKVEEGGSGRALWLDPDFA